MSTRRAITQRFRYAVRCFKAGRKVQRTYRRTLRWLEAHAPGSDVARFVVMYRRLMERRAAT